MHPLMLHLPIGLLTALVLIEASTLWARFSKAAGARQFLLLMTVISTVLTASCGWGLGLTGDYENVTLSWHKWLGTFLVPMVFMLQALLSRGSLGAYRIWLGLTMLLLIAVGHYGGILVRGEGYLFRRTVSSTGRPGKDSPGNSSQANGAAATAFDALVQPILNEYCISCHGAEKSKGKLRLDGAPSLLKGGESGPVIQPGSAAQSPLIQRLRLSPDLDDHMPPSGKKQPSPADIAVLEWWINVGAPMDKTISELKMPETR